MDPAGPERDNPSVNNKPESVAVAEVADGACCNPKTEPQGDFADFSDFYMESNGNANGHDDDDEDQIVDFIQGDVSNFDNNFDSFFVEPTESDIKKEHSPQLIDFGNDPAPNTPKDELEEDTFQKETLDQVDQEVEVIADPTGHVQQDHQVDITDAQVEVEIQEEVPQENCKGSADPAEEFQEFKEVIHTATEKSKEVEQIMLECAEVQVQDSTPGQGDQIHQQEASSVTESKAEEVATTKPDSQADSDKHEKDKDLGIGNEMQCLINDVSAATASLSTGNQQRQASQRIPNGTTSNNTKSKAKSAAVTQNTQKKGVVNKSSTPKSEPKLQDVRSAPSRRLESIATNTRASSTPSAARPQTSTQRVLTGPVKVGDSNSNKAKPSRASPAQNPSTSGSRGTSASLFETSPLAAGVSPELKKLAKTTPSHLIRPNSSVYRPTTSLPPAKAKAPVAPTKASDTPSSPAKPFKPTQALAEKPKTSSTKPANSPNIQPVKMGDADGSGDKSPLNEKFSVFSRFGDSASDGKHITLSNCDKWMKQAHVIDGKKITTTDTSILFKKLFKTAKKIGFEDFKNYVEELAKTKKMEPKELLDKLSKCGAPGTTSATKAASGGVIERLTDTSKYTGSHKERFDSAGKGRGIEGRRNVQDDSGYVAAFKEKKEEEKKKTPTPAK